MRRHLITFGGGEEWPAAAERLGRQALESGVFNTVSVFDSRTIWRNFPEFLEHERFVASNPRGWGYWLWKPFLVWRILRDLPDGDQLIYLDAGFELPRFGIKALRRLLEEHNDEDVLQFDYSSAPILRLMFWSKKALADRFSRDYGLTNLETVPMASAGSIAIRKSERGLRLAELWYRICCAEEYSYIDDTPSRIQNMAPFFENRHDQAVLSFVLAYFGVKSSGDALSFDYRLADVERSKELLFRPLLALRNKSSNSQLPMNLNLIDANIARLKSALQSSGVLRHPVGPTEIVVNKMQDKLGHDVSSIILNGMDVNLGEFL